MSRRRPTSFLAALLLAGAVSACATVPARPPAETIDGMLSRGARVMWIAAHPDDEVLSGAILARASLYWGNALSFLIFTRGEGGECCRPEGCLPDLPTVRAGELKKVAMHYRAGLQHETFWNAPLPMESFPPREKIAAKWKAQRDPALVVAASIRRFRPDLVITFDPDHGFTGHPEHQLASRFAGAGIRLAADPDTTVEGLPPHRVTHFFHALNSYGLFRLLGAADPGVETDTFDATLPCVGTRRCIDVMADFSRAHRSQANDMGNARMLTRWITEIHLRRVDPFKEQKDPFEPIANPRNEAAP